MFFLVLFCFILFSISVRSTSSYQRLHSISVLGFGVEAGAGFVDAGEVAVAHDAGAGMLVPKAEQQLAQRLLLPVRAGVGGKAVAVETALVADAQRVAVVALGMGAGELLVACLVDVAVAGHVIVVAREAEPIGVAADELQHAEGLVAARGAAVDNDQINLSHTVSLNDAALHAEAGGQGGEDGDDELDDGLPSVDVLDDFHNGCGILRMSLL